MRQIEIFCGMPCTPLMKSVKIDSNLPAPNTGQSGLEKKLDFYHASEIKDLF
jgi:hypothetical protein